MKLIILFILIRNGNTYRNYFLFWNNTLTKNIGIHIRETQKKISWCGRESARILKENYRRKKSV